MALMETHYYSSCLGSNITLNVFVPTPSSNEEITDQKVREKYRYEKGLPVIYLLHGAYGDAFSWIRYSNIERYAQEKGIIAVMASAENSFYQNLKSGKKYEKFFTEELPTFIQNVFPASKKREDTYIAGLSMGGYGAWYLGLSHPELYAGAASLSGAVDIAEIFNMDSSAGPFNISDSFGDISTPEGSEYDLLYLYDKAKEKGTVPELYQAVGYDDFLYKGNLRIKAELEKRGANLTFEEGEGAHTWDFWDSYIKKVLEWIKAD